MISYLELVFLDFRKGGEGQKINFWTGEMDLGRKLDMEMERRLKKEEE